MSMASYKTQRPYALHSDRRATGPHYVRRAAGYSLSLMEKMLASHIRVEGVEHISSDGPILFLSNHFTRFETFILPWLLDRHTKRFVNNLAHSSLFHGRFGEFLNAVGARSTKEPGIKESIVGDLITGHHDWVIYPEGSMIKDKHIYERGQFQLHTPDRQGPPHTGAALMALQAAVIRQRYLAAWQRDDQAVLAELEQQWDFTGAQVPKTPLKIVPITITYFPIRPGENLIYRLARKMLKKVPAELEEELSIEGSLLLKETDICVYLGEPIALESWVEPLTEVHGTLAWESTLTQAKDDLTNRVMGDIYRHVTVNIDHLFAAGLRVLTKNRVRCDEFHRALYLAARMLQSSGDRRSHPSLGDSLLSLASGAPNASLENVQSLAVQEGLLTIEDGWYLINRQALAADHDFHRVRLKSTLQVIANELEPLRPAIKALREAVNLPRERLAERLTTLLHREDVAEYRHDWRLSLKDPGERKGHEIGEPFMLGQGPTSLVVSHGYLSAPGEIRELAGRLTGDGCQVYAARLSGHGTSPQQLGHTGRADWRRSFSRAHAAAGAAGEPVILVGFSMGGLLALDAAARLPQRVAGIVVINTPLSLQDPASHLAPAVDAWNSMAQALHLDRLCFTAVLNNAEWPDINYDRNPVASLHELELLMGEVRGLLPQVRCPVLILQADFDPVVVPSSAEELLARLGTEEKSVQRLAFKRHGITRGEGSTVVSEQIIDFVARLRRSW